MGRRTTEDPPEPGVRGSTVTSWPGSRNTGPAPKGWAEQAGVIISPTEYVLTFDPSGAEPLEPDSLGQAFGRLVVTPASRISSRSALAFHLWERCVIPSDTGRWSSSSPRPLTARPTLRSRHPVSFPPLRPANCQQPSTRRRAFWPVAPLAGRGDVRPALSIRAR